MLAAEEGQSSKFTKWTCVQSTKAEDIPSYFISAYCTREISQVRVKESSQR